MELGDVRSIEEVVLQGARLCIRRHQAVLPVDIHFFLLSFDSLIRLNERQVRIRFHMMPHFPLRLTGALDFDYWLGNGIDEGYKQSFGTKAP